MTTTKDATATGGAASGATASNPTPALSTADIATIVGAAPQWASAAQQLAAQTQSWAALFAPLNKASATDGAASSISSNTGAATDTDTASHPTTAAPASSALGNARTFSANATNAAPSNNAGAATGLAASLNLSKLQPILPAKVYALIPATAAKFNINTRLRLAHFLAQCAAESANFSETVEDLNYSAARILEVWPSKFNASSAAAAANNPELLANTAYAGVNGNGDVSSGDGFQFRGRGYLQLTGRGNYAACQGQLGADFLTNPSLLATDYPLLSAAAFCNFRTGFWTACDSGENRDAVEKVTRIVNGGLNGLERRWQYFQQFNSALND